jgi:hypothetical protein
MSEAHASTQVNSESSAEAAPQRAVASLQTARLRYLWAPLITGLVGLFTAVTVQLLTSSKLGEASSNFEKMSQTVESLAAEVKANRDELLRLETLVDHLLDDVIARNQRMTSNVAHHDAPAPPSAPAEPAASDGLIRLQEIKRDIAASPLKNGSLNTATPPHQLFSH